MSKTIFRIKHNKTGNFLSENDFDYYELYVDNYGTVLRVYEYENEHGNMECIVSDVSDEYTVLPITE